jgi:hypothetical protein
MLRLVVAVSTQILMVHGDNKPKGRNPAYFLTQLPKTEGFATPFLGDVAKIWPAQALQTRLARP